MAKTISASALLLAACASDVEPHRFTIGPRFLWGSATAPYQVEGGNHFSDWYQFEQSGAVASGESADDGPGHLERFAQDFDLARGMGHNAYRMGIEWGRVEPVRGSYDEAALARYREILQALRARGIEPMVTLQHFTFPTWVQNLDAETAGLGGWAGRPGEGDADAAVVRELTRFAGEMAARFGTLVDLWCTVNEPSVLVSLGYLAASQPPGHRFDYAGASRASVHMAYANAAMYDVIHVADKVDADGDGLAALVGMAHHLRVFAPRDPADARDVEGAAKLDAVFNWSMLDSTVRGDLDRDFDGDYDDAGEGQGMAALARRADYVGINYYTRSLVLGADLHSADGTYTIKGLPQDGDDPAVERTDVGWEVYPDGFRDLLVQAAQRYQLPIYVTENGIADARDAQRARFIVRHVKAMQQAMLAGADVRGYFHWSLMDNFEWAYGFRPRFGLLFVDYTSPLRTRVRTRGADALSAIIAARGVTPGIELAFGQ